MTMGFPQGVGIAQLTSDRKVRDSTLLAVLMPEIQNRSIRGSTYWLDARPIQGTTAVATRKKLQLLKIVSKIFIESNDGTKDSRM